MTPNLNEAFVCILDRSGATLPAGIVDRLADSLTVNAGTTSSLQRGSIGIAVVHAGTGKPLLDCGDLLVGVNGRIEIDAQTANGVESEEISAFRRSASDFFRQLTGPFVFIAGDPSKNQLSLSRDQLGQRGVYYYLDQRWFIAASEPAAIFNHPAVPNEIDEHSVAHYLGFNTSHSEGSFFRHIKRLPPAHSLQVSARAHETGQYWRFHVDQRYRKASAEQLAEAFRRHLSDSIEQDMQGFAAQEVGLSLSGGMDSPLLAALATRKPQCFSWDLGRENQPEQQNIRVVADYLDLPVQWVEGEGAYPLCGDFIEQFVRASSPHCNAFSMLKHRLYEAATKSGCRLMMVGDSGDNLYGQQEYWLRDLLLDGKLAAFGESFARTVWRSAHGNAFSQSSLRHLLPVTGKPRAPWLSKAARALLSPPGFSPIMPSGSRKLRFNASLSAMSIELESEERQLFAQSGIARSNPFRHWPLLQMALNLPAYWLHRDGVSKVLARVAMKDRLPAQLLNSGRLGLLGWFFLRGLGQNRNLIKEIVFVHPVSDWQRYVRKEWLAPYLQYDQLSFGHTILWRVISYELWCRSRMGIAV